MKNVRLNFLAGEARLDSKWNVKNLDALFLSQKLVSIGSPIFLLHWFGLEKRCYAHGIQRPSMTRENYALSCTSVVLKYHLLL